MNICFSERPLNTRIHVYGSLPILLILSFNLIAWCHRFNPFNFSPAQTPNSSPYRSNEDPSDSSNTTPSSSLTLTTSAPTAKLGSGLTLVVSGGTPPYRLSLLSGGGTLDHLVETNNKLVATFKSPRKRQTDPSVVEAVDSMGARLEKEITISYRKPSTLPNYSKVKRAMDAIHAPAAWGIHTDCSQVVVGVLDSGLDSNHAHLKPNIHSSSAATLARLEPIEPSEITLGLLDAAEAKTLTRGSENEGDDTQNNSEPLSEPLKDDSRGWNFVSNSNDTNDDEYHGTHVTGTIAFAPNTKAGVIGVCWKASILPIKVLDETGNGATSNMIAGVNYGVEKGAKILNMSFGGGKYNQLFKNSLDHAEQNGVLVIAASGNSSKDNDINSFYPAGYSSRNIISVAATEAGTDQLARFSNYGHLSVHISAPGSAIWSATPSHRNKIMQSNTSPVLAGYDSLSGTSQAVPHVTGAAALIWSFEPSLSLYEVKNRILDFADQVPRLNGKVQNNRRLNAFRSLYGL